MLSLFQDLKHHWLTEVLTSGARSDKTKVWWYPHIWKIYLVIFRSPPTSVSCAFILMLVCVQHPSKHARSNLEAFWLRPVMASMQPESGHIIYAGSDFLHPVWFLPSKEGPDHTVQNCPRSDLDDLFRFWSNASGPEASGCATCVFFFILILMTFPLLCPLSPKNSFSTLSIQVNGIMCYKCEHHHQHQESLGPVLAEHKLAHC